MSTASLLPFTHVNRCVCLTYTQKHVWVFVSSNTDEMIERGDLGLKRWPFRLGQTPVFQHIDFASRKPHTIRPLLNTKQPTLNTTPKQAFFHLHASYLVFCLTYTHGLSERRCYIYILLWLWYISLLRLPKRTNCSSVATMVWSALKRWPFRLFEPFIFQTLISLRGSLPQCVCFFIVTTTHKCGQLVFSLF